jgi:hypothetical protein
MAEKHRSQRGTLTSRIKDAIFSVFGEANLPPISMNASPAEVNKWKRTPAVKKCYSNLHQLVSDDSEASFMLRIVERVFVDSKNSSEILIAYTVNVCEIFLNPDSENIQISESVMKKKLKEKLVNFAI